MKKTTRGRFAKAINIEEKYSTTITTRRGTSWACEDGERANSVYEIVRSSLPKEKIKKRKERDEKKEEEKKNLYKKSSLPFRARDNWKNARSTLIDRSRSDVYKKKETKEIRPIVIDNKNKKKRRRRSFFSSSFRSFRFSSFFFVQSARAHSRRQPGKLSHSRAYLSIRTMIYYLFQLVARYSIRYSPSYSILFENSPSMET